VGAFLRMTVIVYNHCFCGFGIIPFLPIRCVMAVTTGRLDLARSRGGRGGAEKKKVEYRGTEKARDAEELGSIL
jgi:hypothetical protein